MIKKLVFVILGLVIAGGSIWYIINGGTETDTENISNTQTTQNNDSAPTEKKDLLSSILDKQKNTKTFNELIVLSGVGATLQETGPYTVLAPEDDAFDTLPEGLLDSLKKVENKELLTSIVNYHIIKGSLLANDFQNAAKLPTVNGREILVEVKDQETYLISTKGIKARATKSDISASNGAIHIIDSVLIPQ